jgi:hypothetical protein
MSGAMSLIQIFERDEDRERTRRQGGGGRATRRASVEMGGRRVIGALRDVSVDERAKASASDETSKWEHGGRRKRA